VTKLNRLFAGCLIATFTFQILPLSTANAFPAFKVETNSQSPECMQAALNLANSLASLTSDVAKTVTQIPSILSVNQGQALLSAITQDKNLLDQDISTLTPLIAQGGSCEGLQQLTDISQMIPALSTQLDTAKSKINVIISNPTALKKAAAAKAAAAKAAAAAAAKAAAAANTSHYTQGFQWMSSQTIGTLTNLRWDSWFPANKKMNSTTALNFCSAADILILGGVWWGFGPYAHSTWSQGCAAAAIKTPYIEY